MKGVCDLVKKSCLHSYLLSLQGDACLSQRFSQRRHHDIFQSLTKVAFINLTTSDYTLAYVKRGI